jgi:hypothetical protein
MTRHLFAKNHMRESSTRTFGDDLIRALTKPPVEYAHIRTGGKDAEGPSVLPPSTATMSFAHLSRDRARPIFCSSLWVSRTGVMWSSICTSGQHGAISLYPVARFREANLLRSNRNNHCKPKRSAPSQISVGPTTPAAVGIASCHQIDGPIAQKVNSRAAP